MTTTTNTLLAAEIKPNGFCGGVKNAIELINSIVDDNNTIKPIYMMGYLVHNKKIVNSYQNIKGIKVVTSNYETFINSIDFGTIIFTAHGISPKILNLAKEKGLNIIDTTCINVRKIQTMIQDKVKSSNVLVIGNNNHPEVMGYLGISDKVKLYNNNSSIADNTFVVNQTTLVYNDVLKTFNKLKVLNPTITISEEICTATKTRQKAVIDNLKNFDMFLVIGDKLSNNCRSLYDIIIENKKIGYQIEDITELNNINLKGIKTIGVTAGASTPPMVVKEIIDELNTYYDNKVFSSKLTDLDYLKY